MRALTRPGPRTLRISAMGAAELDHELVDDPMKMQAVVEFRFGETNEIARRDGHGIQKKLYRDLAEGRLKNCCRVCHAR